MTISNVWAPYAYYNLDKIKLSMDAIGKWDIDEGNANSESERRTSGDMGMEA
jgi:hypothetical protein